MKMRPVNFVWTDNGTMVPEPRFATLCDRQFVIGEIYPLQVVEARSMASHNHYFASLHEMWNNLPEDTAKRFPTVEALRAWALVQAGFYTEKDYVCDTPAKATYLARIIRAYAEYAVIKISGNVVKVFDPKSQSIASMSSEEFKASKEAVLDIVAALNPGLSRTAVAKEATRRAPPEKASKHPSNSPANGAPVRSVAPEATQMAGHPADRANGDL